MGRCWDQIGKTTAKIRFDLVAAAKRLVLTRRSEPGWISEEFPIQVGWSCVGHGTAARSRGMPARLSRYLRHRHRSRGRSGRLRSRRSRQSHHARLAVRQGTALSRITFTIPIDCFIRCDAVGPKGGGNGNASAGKKRSPRSPHVGKRFIAESGAEAILPYSYSGTLGLVQMIVSSARLWNRLGASRVASAASSAPPPSEAVEATVGKRWSPPYSDILASRLVLIWGHNPISTAPHFMPFLRQAQHAGCHVVVIDPAPYTNRARGRLAPRSASGHATARWRWRWLMSWSPKGCTMRHGWRNTQSVGRCCANG